MNEIEETEARRQIKGATADGDVGEEIRNVESERMLDRAQRGEYFVQLDQERAAVCR